MNMMISESHGGQTSSLSPFKHKRSIVQDFKLWDGIEFAMAFHSPEIVSERGERRRRRSRPAIFKIRLPAACPGANKVHKFSPSLMAPRIKDLLSIGRLSRPTKMHSIFIETYLSIADRQASVDKRA